MPLDLGNAFARRLQVDFSALEVALRRLALFAELGDACRLLEYPAPVLGFRLNKLLDFALSDNAVTVLARARVVEKIGDVAHPAPRAVDVVLAQSAAVELARDRHLVERQRREQLLVRIVKDERNLAI